MAVHDLTAADFEQTIQGNDIVLVDFWASWCGPCRQFAPVYDTASERHPDVVFGKVDTEAEQALAGAANITSIPTLMAFREGILVFAQPGALPAPALEDVITQVRELDMGLIRRQVAARQALMDTPLEVTADDFAERMAAGDLTVVDVREPGEYRIGHVPGARMMPLQSVPEHAGELPPDAPVYVICASGGRSMQATRFLRQNGVEAYNVAGGTNAWLAAGREIVPGPFPTVDGEQS